MIVEQAPLEDRLVGGDPGAQPPQGAQGLVRPGGAGGRSRVGLPPEVVQGLVGLAVEGCHDAAKELGCSLIEVEQLAGLGLVLGEERPGELVSAICRGVG